MDRANGRAYIAEHICHGLGVDLVEYAPGDGLVIVGLGSGIVMAVGDHLRNEYPLLGLRMADLPGALGLAARVTALDYLGSAFPALFLMWSSLTNGSVYPRALADRGFRPARLWVYCKGVGEEDAKQAWAELGAVCFEDMWCARPLGNWTPTPTSPLAESDVLVAPQALSMRGAG